MAISTRLVNTATNEAITLSDGMLYEDEDNWSRIVGNAERVLSGRIIVQTSERYSGKPITLKSQANRGWLKKRIVDQLKAARDSGGKYWLFYKSAGEVKQIKVMFDYIQEPITSTPIEEKQTQSPDAYCSVTLRFLEDETV